MWLSLIYKYRKEKKKVRKPKIKALNLRNIIQNQNDDEEHSVSFQQIARYQNYLIANGKSICFINVGFSRRI